ncbi:Homeobox protein GHOX-7-like protein [Leptotrombidium deliense]|uniref:Homeobox protein GHOX-7-like protein n=1 Tax=Leptotrombidium deliense TaxID=299467 RepID=A0A443SU75_9ACAR|nr:Homeobox protein GHOX-7-like protein [Leptotrombidium deliense]
MSMKCTLDCTSEQSSNSGKRKAANRGPRIPFTSNQIAALERKFKDTHYLSSCEVVELSEALDLTEARTISDTIWMVEERAIVKTWFSIDAKYSRTKE